jgi:DNA repair protein RadA/Sms
MGWFQDWLGPIPRGTNLLLSGDPGTGKSSLALQLALGAAAAGERVLYLATEQTSESLEFRSALLAVHYSSHEHVTIKDDLFDLNILPKFLTHQVLRRGSQFHGTTFIVIDSLQGFGTGPQDKKTWSAIYEFLRLASGEGMVVLAIAHATKSRAIAGPRGLEHAVDVTLLLKHGVCCRALTAPKCRIGPAKMDPFSLATSDLTTRLEPSPLGIASVARVKTLGCGRTVEIEVVVAPARHDRGFVKAPGLSSSEIEIILDLVERLFPEARYAWAMGITVRAVGGLNYGREHNLPVALAFLAAITRGRLAQDSVILGDMDLEGRVLPLSEEAARGLASAHEEGSLSCSMTVYCGAYQDHSEAVPAGLPMTPVNALSELASLLLEGES